ncbi:MAG TPA: glutamate--tRNA ligase, partial [Patescibacteria group bacterium]|nr:glutamate--tRNA ligase [Patescibacteria group bacterium]
YRQSDRLASYQTYAEDLVKKGHAYYCSCTPARLEEMRKTQEAKHQPPKYDGHCRELNLSKKEGYTVRLKVPKEGVTRFTDLIRGDVSFENKLLDDQVILKSDGFPTYHLGVVVDDHEMDISHIIRGEEWISSTPKHILLYQFFGWDVPNIAHVSVLRNPDKSKLSKRKNPVWVSDYRAKGYLPEAIRNYLASLAWSYPDGRDIFALREMISVFDISQLKTSAPIFDVEKLRWMNGEYIRMMKATKLKDQISNFYGGKYDDDRVEKILPLVKERMKTLAEFESLAGFFFENPREFERPVSIQLVQLLQSILSHCAWSHDDMEKAIRDAAEKQNVKAKDLFMELRLAVTGKTVGPPLLESLEILGKEETLSRLQT